MLVARMLPCFRHFTHPWLKLAKDATAPPILSLLGAAEARAIENPDVLALTSGPGSSPTGCHSALTERSCSSQLLGLHRDCLVFLS